MCFCYESEVLNDVYVCFMFEDLVLVESLKGDAHYAAWQRTGEVCDAIIAMVRIPTFTKQLTLLETYLGSAGSSSREQARSRHAFLSHGAEEEDLCEFRFCR